MHVRFIVRLLLTAITLAVLWNGYSSWTSHAAATPKRDCSWAP